MAQILIIDDDEGMRYTLSALAKKLGHTSLAVASLKEGLGAASSTAFDVVLLDVKLPDGDGLSAIPEFKASPSGPEVIIVTGYGDPDGAELAIRTGAWDYIEKGASLKEISLRLNRALEYRTERIKYRPPALLNREGIIGSSPGLEACIDLLAQAAASDASVLVTGETGTGKELFARAIHRNSARGAGDMVVVDCAALPEHLVESILFGHEKGSFTGADRAAYGLLRQAHGGTLFLDEVGELPLNIQRAFLRVLQERSFRPVGSTREVESDFRVVAATNRDLDYLVSAGKFRQDLLFRLRSLTISIPPLRSRTEDIRELAVFYTDRLCARYGLGQKALAPEFLEALEAYSWPGNVRELINALERSIAAARELPTLFAVHLPTHIRAQLARSSVKTGPKPEALRPEGTGEEGPRLPDLQTLLNSTERRYMKELLTLTDWDIKKACSISGLSRSRFYERLKKHGIQRPA